MSVFPEWFDPRAEVLFALNLVSIDTPDGVFGFLLGVDGIFTDVNGLTWYGSQLIRGGDDEYSIAGSAPSGQLTLAFFQDPAAPDVVAQIRDLGANYVSGRDLVQYVQPLRSQAEFSAPTVPPIPVMTRVMRQIRYRLDEGQGRSIGLSYEGGFETRRQARRMVWNTVDHARLIGEANPSLQFVPQIYDREEKLF